MPRFLNFQRNSIIHIRMLLYLETCFMRVTFLLLCRLQAVSKIHVPIIPILLVKGEFIFNVFIYVELKNVRYIKDCCSL